MGLFVVKQRIQRRIAFGSDFKYCLRLAFRFLLLADERNCGTHCSLVSGQELFGLVLGRRCHVGAELWICDESVERCWRCCCCRRRNRSPEKSAAQDHRFIDHSPPPRRSSPAARFREECYLTCVGEGKQIVLMGRITTLDRASIAAHFSGLWLT